MIVGDWLGRREQYTPDKIAVIDTIEGNREITYREWSRAVNRMGRFLTATLGVQKGDRVAVLSYNCMEYLDIWFALGRVGGILQNLNWRLTPYELSGLVEDAAPVALVYGPEFIPAVRQLREKATAVHHFVAIGEKDRPEDICIADRLAYSDAPLPEIDLDWDDPWVICYTGGTTGLPKGAILTHRAITANAVNTIVSWDLDSRDIAILNSPLFHTGGLNVFTAPLIEIGGTNILCKSFDADQTYNLIRDYNVTLFFGVPTMFLMLQQHPRWPEADFSKLKLVMNGGASCPLPIFEKFWERGISFKTGYGLTEAGPNTFILPAKDVRRKPGAVGFPLMHVDLKLVREDGSLCEANEVGELLICGPHVCAGYWNRPEETARAIVDGWLHTGDLAVCDEEGYYTIKGRLKDMIISGGENVYPAEVESAMHDHPAVAAAALIGVPDPKWGEVGRAVVVLHPGKAVTAAELTAYLRTRLAGYKVPKSIVFVDALPLTGANKIDKKVLEERFGTPDLH